VEQIRLTLAVPLRTHACAVADGELTARRQTRRDADASANTATGNSRASIARVSCAVPGEPGDMPETAGAARTAVLLLVEPSTGPRNVPVPTHPAAKAGNKYHFLHILLPKGHRLTTATKIRATHATERIRRTIRGNVEWRDVRHASSRGTSRACVRATAGAASRSRPRADDARITSEARDTGDDRMRVEPERPSASTSQFPPMTLQ
jgi:hypothetical protein